MSRSILPVHPSLRHPLTGKPIRALYIDKHGRSRYPMMGGDETADAAAKAATEKAAAEAAVAKAAEDAAAKASKNAVDADGKDLGYPKDTPVADMTEDQKAAFGRHKSEEKKKKVQEWKAVTGDRTPEQLKKDLDDLAELRKSNLTASERAIEEAKEEGRKEATSSERTKAAEAILRGALEAGDIKGDELEEIVADYNLSRAISDQGIDTTKITNYAKRFTSGKDDKKTRRDFGGGPRKDGDATRGAGGKAEAARRFKKDKAQA